MQQKSNSLKDLSTRDLFQKPTVENVVPGNRLYKIKTNENGAIETYKARYVAKGVQQIEGRECFDTIAPTCRPKLFRILLSWAANEILVQR